jgi:orotate phosphoribosyltransferase
VPPDHPPPSSNLLEEHLVYDKSALVDIVRDKALKRGKFTLASGKEANYYLDCRRVTLDSTGALVVAEGVLERLGDTLPDAVGGMAIGADPITAAVLTLGALRGKSLKGFIVRKEEKKHGMGRQVEGPVQPGDEAVIVEDVVTTGGSALKAIERVEQFGMRVRGVIGIVDRLEGGAEAFAKRGYQLETLLTIRDLGIEPPAE